MQDIQVIDEYVADRGHDIGIGTGNMPSIHIVPNKIHKAPSNSYTKIRQRIRLGLNLLNFSSHQNQPK